jgi:hypothetical protein
LGAAAPSLTYSGHKGFFVVVAGLAILVTSFLLLLALINLQAVCIPERWPLVVNCFNEIIYNKFIKFDFRKCFGVHLLPYFILLQVLLLQQLQNIAAFMELQRYMIN